MSTEHFIKRYYCLPRRQIGMLRFLLESYDGLAFMRTIDKVSGLVEIAWPPSRAADVEALLLALIGDLAMEPTPRPERVPEL
jgi:hypothetical protein